MDLDGNQLLSVTIPEYVRVRDPGDDEVYFVLNVKLGTHQKWTIRRSYAQFSDFNQKCEQKFGTEAVPYFTGRIPFNYKSDANSEKRRYKLEEYIQSTLTKWVEWRPTKGLVTTIPHPDGDPEKKAKIHNFLFDFLDFRNNMVMVDVGEAYKEQKRKEAEAKLAQQRENAEEARQQKVQREEMSEAQAYQERLRADAAAAAAAATGQPAAGVAAGGDPVVLAAVTGGVSGAAATSAFVSAALTGQQTDGRQQTAPASKGNAKVAPAAGTAANQKAAAASAAAAAAKAAPVDTVDCIDDDDGFSLVIERDNEKTKTELRKFTSRISVLCKEHRVVPNSHVEYVLSVAVCGATWQCRKRYSEMEKLHELLLKVYGEYAITRGLPDFNEAFAPSWAKLDEGTALKRQAFFSKYLTALVSHVDRWRPMDTKRQMVQTVELEMPSSSATPDASSSASGLFTAESTNAVLRSLASGGGAEAKIAVDFNKVVYDFLDFAGNLGRLDAASAIQEQKDKEKTLLPQQQQDLANERQELARRTAVENFEDRSKKRPGILRDEEIQDFAAMLSSCDDDRDAIQIAVDFVTRDYYRPDVPRATHLLRLRAQQQQQQQQQQPPSLQSVASFTGALDAADGNGDLSGATAAALSALVAEPGFAGLSRSSSAIHKEAERIIGPAKTPCALTSKQLADLVRDIPFDDTRQIIIKILAHTLIDDVHLKLVLDTVLFEWSALERDVRDAFGRRDGQGGSVAAALSSYASSPSTARFVR